MKIRHSSHFLRRLKKRLSKNPSLKKEISKQVKVLTQNKYHPSLKIHKLKGERAQEYTFWIKGNLRITFIIIDQIIVFTDIITHDEY